MVEPEDKAARTGSDPITLPNKILAIYKGKKLDEYKTKREVELHSRLVWLQIQVSIFLYPMRSAGFFKNAAPGSRPRTPDEPAPA